MNVKPQQLVLRCFASKSGAQWQAFCLDLDLAVQGDSLEEVKQKISGQIAEYVYDALAGEDTQYAEQLLSRRAPLSLWATYYWAGLVHKIFHFQDGVRRFTERMPLVPAHHEFA